MEYTISILTGSYIETWYATTASVYTVVCVVNNWCIFAKPLLQKPANILVMGEGTERGRVKIGKLYHIMYCVKIL